jgi:RecA-family ATPase
MSNGINVLNFSRDMLGNDARIPDGATASLESISARELDVKSFDNIHWIVPGILPSGVTLLAGAPKCGKSWLMMNWCAAVASGGKVFGDLDVEPGHVLYLALEDNERRLKDRLRKVCRGHIPDFLHFGVSAPRLDNGLIPRLMNWLNSRPKTRMVVIDTLARIRPPSEKSTDMYRSDYLIGSQLLPLAAKYNLSIVLVHHTNKSKASDQLELVSGSQGLSGGCDNVFLLTRGRGEDSAVLYVTGRDIESERNIDLRWDQQLATWMRSNETSINEHDDTLSVFRSIRNARQISALQLMSQTQITTAALKPILCNLRDRGLILIDGENGVFSIP